MNLDKQAEASGVFDAQAGVDGLAEKLNSQKLIADPSVQRSKLVKLDQAVAEMGEDKGVPLC